MKGNTNVRVEGETPLYELSVAAHFEYEEEQRRTRQAWEALGALAIRALRETRSRRLVSTVFFSHNLT